MWPIHLSARIPWHDNGWIGTVCKEPNSNTCCTSLSAIKEKRDVSTELPFAGQNFVDLSFEPPCVREGVTFMSPGSTFAVADHPYSYLWKNLQQTKMKITPYSIAVVPFERMLKESASDIAQEWDLDFDKRREPKETIDRPWVNSDKNQEALLNGFFDVLKPEESLVFFYTKKTPLTEEPTFVLIGVGRIKKIPQGRDWEGSDHGMRQVYWDRVIDHSIRPDFKDGFLMPYQQILEQCEEQDIDPSKFAARVPNESGTDFLYRAGLVSIDSALAALISLQEALERAVKELNIQGDWNQVQQWLRERIKECWFDRGPCPGLRAALAAVGLESPSAAALEIHHLAKGGNPWKFVEDACYGNPANSKLGRLFRGLPVTKLIKMKERESKRYCLLQLLSRFNLSKEQAIDWMKRSDGFEALKDPYQLYIKTRRDVEPISFKVIDRTIFGEKPKEGAHIGLNEEWLDPPITEPRRLAALVIASLESGKDEGHSWLPNQAIINRISDIVEEKPPQLEPADLDLLKDYLEPLKSIENHGWQLDYLFEAESVIRNEVKRRLTNTIPNMTFNSKQLVDDAINKQSIGEKDETARKEKATALEILAGSSISTLDGPAGTGKTTVIRALAAIPGLGNMLCLAPTGKARVQIERTFEGVDRKKRPTVKTIHSFLLDLGRYDYESGFINASNNGGVSREFSTVVIDESSMIETQMLAAVLASCIASKRIVLVGDPRQLPPIGAGRPFVDIIEFLHSINGPTTHLRTIMRTKNEETAPFLFAQLFDCSNSIVDDSLWSWPNKESEGNLHFDYWKEPDELFEKVEKAINDRLPPEIDLGKAFDKWMGGNPYKKTYYFNRGCARNADQFQILSPRRSGSTGTDELNLKIKSTYREHWLKEALQNWVIPKPMGDMQITYGDKVICNQNHKNKDMYPQDPDALGYVANGEVGMAIGPRTSKNAFFLKKLEVEFSSQMGVGYKFWINNDELLELSYALTIHRAQGSQFKETIVIVPQSQRVSPEMMYTALTRSEGHVTVLIEGNSETLLAATHPRRSEVGKRLTNLFTTSNYQLDDDMWFDSNRIHRAENGIYVRSKSELVIANMLHSHSIKFIYESILDRDGRIIRPDFTIITQNRTYYWEHLGMMTDPGYAKKWENKKAWYDSHGITDISETEQLLISRDGPDGSLDSEELKKIIELLI